MTKLVLGLLLIQSLQNDKLPKIFLCFESVINLLTNGRVSHRIEANSKLKEIKLIFSLTNLFIGYRERLA